MNIKLIIVIVLIVGGTLYLFKPAEPPVNAPTNNIVEEKNEQPKVKENITSEQITPPTLSSPEKVVVEMTSSGFLPKTLVVKKGTEVVFLNKDSVSHWPASGPHPAHTCYPGFDVLSAVAPGTSYNHVFDIEKTCGFHDHINFTTYGYGSITVTE